MTVLKVFGSVSLRINTEAKYSENKGRDKSVLKSENTTGYAKEGTFVV